MEAEASPPWPYFNKGHCKGISNGSCKLSHTAQTCWTDKCRRKNPTCKMRHPRSCNLFFRSSRGCHRSNCSHRHLPTQHDPTVLIARQTAAGGTQSDLHEKLAAQEVVIQSLPHNVSRLESKLGNNEKLSKENLEMLNIKLSGEIGFLMNQNESSREKLEMFKESLGTSKLNLHLNLLN